MCGVPFHSADSYIARLVAKGHEVAICEQLEDPALARQAGCDPRGHARHGRENSMLDESRNNYLACVCVGKMAPGCALQMFPRVKCITDFRRTAARMR